MNLFDAVLNRLSNNVLPSQANMAQGTSWGMPIAHGIVPGLQGNPFSQNQDQVGLQQKPSGQWTQMAMNMVAPNPFDQLRQQLGQSNDLLAAGKAFGTPGSYGDAINNAAHNDQMSTMMHAVMAKLNPGGGGQPTAAGPQVGPQDQNIPWAPQSPADTPRALPRSRSRMPGGNSYSGTKGTGVAPPGSPDFDPTQGSGNF